MHKVHSACARARGRKPGRHAQRTENELQCRLRAREAEKRENQGGREKGVYTRSSAEEEGRWYGIYTGQREEKERSEEREGCWRRGERKRGLFIRRRDENVGARASRFMHNGSCARARVTVLKQVKNEDRERKTTTTVDHCAAYVLMALLLWMFRVFVKIFKESV